MSTLELRAGVLQNLNQFLDDEDALLKINRFLTNLKDKVQGKCSTVDEEAVPYTISELNARVDEAELEQGGIPSDNVFSEMERKYPWLCE